MEKLRDTFNREINYLRISVTDRCNLRCVYCMPFYGVAQKDPREILSFEEIHTIAKLMASLGVNKIRITGGEPLVRKDIVKLIACLSTISSLDDLSLTTNGLLLAQYARELKQAGLQRINVSLDTLNDAKFKFITRGGALHQVLEGIDEAKNREFFVKLNVVVMQGINTDEIFDFVRWGRDRDIIVRFIEYMPKGKKDLWDPNKYIAMQEVMKKLGSLGSLVPVEGIRGNGPARYFRLQGGTVHIGFISALSSTFCSQCNRLRLTADGFLLSCLAYDYGLSLKYALRNHHDPHEIINLIKEAVNRKPKEHHMGLNSFSGCTMSQVGG